MAEEAFWTDLKPLEFIKETPELQVWDWLVLFVGCFCAVVLLVGCMVHVLIEHDAQAHPTRAYSTHCVCHAVLCCVHAMSDHMLLQSPIAVAGYPLGGDSLSITKGIVSRVAMVSAGVLWNFVLGV